MKIMTTILTALMLLFVAPAWAKNCTHITEDDVLSAQNAWGKGIVSIGAAADPQAAALNHLDTLYAYELGDVLFKPTKAAAVQFRTTRDEALSYFVKGIIPEDQGFALAPYTKVRFENKGLLIDCDSALAMGNYYFTTREGHEVKVEYSFGYRKDPAGQLKINLHHSSIPYKTQ